MAGVNASFIFIFIFHRGEILPSTLILGQLSNNKPQGASATHFALYEKLGKLPLCFPVSFANA